MIEITNLINKLKEKRPIFHSEDDFKLSLGMEILKDCTDCEVRLERPVDIEMVDRNNNPTTARAPIDVVIIDADGNSIPIELKYKTKETELDFGGENYLLTEHGATDIGRYSFRKDIYRIEQYLKNNENSKIGYVLILTNDKAYFETNVSEKNTIDKNMSFHNGAVIKKVDDGWNYDKIDENENKDKYEFKEAESKWYYKDSKKTHWTCKKELFYKLDLLNEYKIEWLEYSSFEKTKFQYCLIKIEKN